MLFIVSTPIGNLADISYRAVETLHRCEYILCEDTRHSAVLLNHYAIKKKLVSYHQHNEAERTEEVLEDLSKGCMIALLSDAGTPGIADPGMRLISACRDAGMPVTPLPGCCAAIAALTAAGMAAETFQFIGFLPRAPSQQKTILRAALQYPGTTICYESPKRLVKTLQTLATLASGATVAVCRELTKLHEEVLRGTAAALLSHYLEKTPRGEIVLIIAGGVEAQKELPSKNSLIDEVNKLQRAGYTTNAAIKAVAQAHGVKKRDLYRLLLNEGSESIDNDMKDEG